MQIGCVVFWKGPRPLTVDAPKDGKYLISTPLKWKMCRETVFDIMVRLYGYRDSPNPNAKYLSIAKSKTNEMATDMIGYIRRLLKQEGAAPLAGTVKIPLAAFTHYLSQRGQYITELGAQLFQYTDILAKRCSDDNWAFVLHCNCCNSAMNSWLDYYDLISLGTRIIMVHMFDNGVCDGDFLKQCNMDENWAPLGKVKMEKPDSLQILPCQPTDYWKPAMKRMELFDAGKVDNGYYTNELQKRHTNAIALSSALLPTDVSGDNVSSYPLVSALSNLIRGQLFGQEASQNKILDGSSNIQIIDKMMAIKNCRPVQVQLTDIHVDPISSLEPDPSWQNVKEQVGLEQVGSGTQDIARYNGELPVELGTLETDNPTVSAYEIRDGRGDGVLHMLSYYYAKSIICIDKGSSCKGLEEKLTNSKIKLPPELKKFMAKFTPTSTFLVVLTDCAQKSNPARAKSTPLGALTDPLIHKLTWYIPSHFFLTMFPKNVIDDLYAGRIHHIFINKETRDKFQNPVLQSLKHEIRQIKLHSQYPNCIYEVLLAGGMKNKRIYINAKDKEDYMKNISEPWLSEKLSSLCNVSGSFGVTIGAGRKAGTKTAACRSENPTNFWCDPRNKNNHCVAGGIANWLFAAGCHSEASAMRTWAESKNVFTSDEGESVKEAFLYMEQHLPIQIAKINFFKNSLTLEDTVSLFRSFPAPCNLLFSCLSSHQTHSLVVSEKIVYDLQDNCPYELTLSGLTRKLNGDRDVITLVGAHYFYVLNGKKIKIPHCPTKPLSVKSDHIPYYGKLISSFGSGGSTKYRKRKKKKNMKKKGSSMTIL